jgi:FdhD protein
VPGHEDGNKLTLSTQELSLTRSRRPRLQPAGHQQLRFVPHRVFNTRPALDELLEEHPVTIEVNARPAATLLCTPVGTAELAVGWAFGRGLFNTVDELHRVTAFEDRVSLMLERPALTGGAWEDLLAARLDPNRVPGLQRLAPDDGAEIGEEPASSATAFRLPREQFLSALDRVCERFASDGGGAELRRAVLTDGAQVCVLARDISRQHAVDKVIGWALRQRIDRARMILCVDGRVDAQIAFKAWRAGIPVVATTAAPTSEAVELAHAAGIALAGRVLRDDRAIYCHAWRLPSGTEET